MNELLEVGILAAEDDSREQTFDGDDDDSHHSHCQGTTSAAKMKKVKHPFREFSRILKKKYDLNPRIYDNMPNKKRNKILQEMMEGYPIVLFPKDNLQGIDGMPHFHICTDNLTGIEPKAEKEKKQKVSKGMDRSELGLPPKMNDGEEKKNKGSAFDPRTFKTNTEYFVHLNEKALELIGNKFAMSESLKSKRKKKVTYGDDYDTQLPDDIIKEMRRFKEADEASSDDDNFQDIPIKERLRKLSVIGSILGKQVLNVPTSKDGSPERSESRSGSKARLRDVILNNKSPLGMSDNIDVKIEETKKNDASSFLKLLKQAVSDKKKTLSAKQSDVLDTDMRSLTRRTIRFNQNQEVSIQMIKQTSKKIFQNDPLDKKRIISSDLTDQIYKQRDKKPPIMSTSHLASKSSIGASSITKSKKDALNN